MLTSGVFRSLLSLGLRTLKAQVRAVGGLVVGAAVVAGVAGAVAVLGVLCSVKEGTQPLSVPLLTR